IADPKPINNTLIRIVGKLGAKASPSIPNILLVKPNGSAYGMGRLSVYIPTTGCITEETMLSVNAMSPSCVKDSPRDFSKIGNIAGITACREAFNKSQMPIINKIEYTGCPSWFIPMFFCNVFSIATPFRYRLKCLHIQSCCMHIYSFLYQIQNVL